MRTDVMVLGAGIVGVCAALDLQARGRDVILVDRNERAGAGTSFGNAGLIERSSYFPYMFPREWRAFARYAFNLAPEAHYQASALPPLAPWLWRYFRNSAPRPAARIAMAIQPLIERSLAEHEILAEAAGVAAQIRRTGWIKIYRSRRSWARGEAEARRLLPFGLSISFLSPADLAALEPNLSVDAAGAVHLRDTASLADPGGYVVALADLFRRRGGKQIVADALTLEALSDGWSLRAQDGSLAAREAVVALGPWSDQALRALGYRVPLAVKRGYHIHFAPVPGAALTRPVLDADGGYVLSPMAMGVRLTTGAEFARRDAPPTPVQIERAEPLARALAPLGARLDAKPWLGARPCLPDMLPIIGKAPRHKGLWFAFGHQHHGLTLGPVTGRLLGEMMTGVQPFADPTPFRADRF